MPFGMLIWVCPRNHVFDRGPDPTSEGVFEGIKERTRICPDDDTRYTQRYLAGAASVWCRCQLLCNMRVHIGTNWWIRLCAGAIQLYTKLLQPSVITTADTTTIININYVAKLPGWLKYAGTQGQTPAQFGSAVRRLDSRRHGSATPGCRDIYAWTVRQGESWPTANENWRNKNYSHFWETSPLIEFWNETTLS